MGTGASLGDWLAAVGECCAAALLPGREGLGDGQGASEARSARRSHPATVEDPGVRRRGGRPDRRVAAALRAAGGSAAGGAGAVGAAPGALWPSPSPCRPGGSGASSAPVRCVPAPSSRPQRPPVRPSSARRLVRIDWAMLRLVARGRPQRLRTSGGGPKIGHTGRCGGGGANSLPPLLALGTRRAVKPAPPPPEHPDERGCRPRGRPAGTSRRARPCLRFAKVIADVTRDG
jgi:hypothetical protein